jgi:hypothetical protein
MNSDFAISPGQEFIHDALLEQFNLTLEPQQPARLDGPGLSPRGVWAALPTQQLLPHLDSVMN